MKSYRFFQFMVVVLLTACTPKKETTEGIEYFGPVMEVDNLALNYSDSGRVVVKLKTAKQLKLKNEDEIYPKPMYISFFDKNGVEYSSLRGDSGRYVRSENLYLIKGNVFFFNRAAQQSLETNELFWTSRDRKIYTDKAVKINTPTRQVQGVGLDAAQDFSKFTIRRPTGIFQVDSLITQPGG